MPFLTGVNMKNKTTKFIIPIVAVIIIYLILDYINLPTLLGLTPANINIDLFGILLDAAIVLILYVISFYYIENKQNEKDANARDTVSVLMEKTYQECWSNLEFLDNRAMISQYIIPKVDGNKTGEDNKIIHNLQTLPFSSFDSILSLATNGHVEKCKLSDYLEIKKEYQYLVNIKIIFFDLVDPETPDQVAMYHDIRTRDARLKAQLRKLLNT